MTKLSDIYKNLVSGETIVTYVNTSKFPKAVLQDRVLKLTSGKNQKLYIDSLGKRVYFPQLYF